jgi:hypothetical protein
VNRVWAWHFGKGIVRTPNDFGSQGDPPTHPDLLDWLARDFMDHGWSIKYLHRLILLSKTYQLDSKAAGAGVQLDPENRLLWHGSRRRLEGEAIRDCMLACAGTLNVKSFGPPVVPKLGRQELTGLFNAKDKWPVTPDKTEYTRRSVYLLVRRTFAYPLFAAFDPPEVMTSCPGRQQTIVPTQALTLLNSPLPASKHVPLLNGSSENVAISRTKSQPEPGCSLTADRFQRPNPTAPWNSCAKETPLWKNSAWPCSIPMNLFSWNEVGPCRTVPATQ